MGCVSPPRSVASPRRVSQLLRIAKYSVESGTSLEKEAGSICSSGVADVFRAPAGSDDDVQAVEEAIWAPGGAWISIVKLRGLLALFKASVYVAVKGL